MDEDRCGACFYIVGVGASRRRPGFRISFASSTWRFAVRLFVCELMGRCLTAAVTATPAHNMRGLDPEAADQ